MFRNKLYTSELRNKHMLINFELMYNWQIITQKIKQIAMVYVG